MSSNCILQFSCLLVPAPHKMLSFELTWLNCHQGLIHGLMQFLHCIYVCLLTLVLVKVLLHFGGILLKIRGLSCLYVAKLFHSRHESNETNPLYVIKQLHEHFHSPNDDQIEYEAPNNST